MKKLRPLFHLFWRPAILCLLCLTAWPLNALADDDLRIRMTLNKSSYLQGDLVTVQAKAYFENGTPVTSTKEMELNIRDSSGRTVFKGQMQNFGGGSFAKSYRLAETAAWGTWRAKIEGEAGGEAGDASRSFTVERRLAVDPNTVDHDGDNFSFNLGDCNDGNAAIFPGATEVCGDGIDQDCSGADLACPIDPNTLDLDGDGFSFNRVTATNPSRLFSLEPKRSVATASTRTVPALIWPVRSTRR